MKKVNNVVSINSRKFKDRNVLGITLSSQNSGYIPDKAFFFTGILSAMVLPEGIYSAYGGLVPLIAFAGCALTGVTWGLIRYYILPYRITSCFSTGTVPQSPPGEDTMRKKAA
jgi:hypothetical protein